MKIIDLFYQGEGVAEIEHLEIEPGAGQAVHADQHPRIAGIAPFVKADAMEAVRPESQETA